MRFGSPIVSGLARRVTKSVRVRDCDVPEGSYLTINFWTINRDSTQWEKPNEFWPRHFYGVDEKGAPCVKNVDHLVPFSLGLVFYNILKNTHTKCDVFDFRHIRTLY